MSATKIKPFTQWADVARTERFIRIVPLSGYRLIQHEYDAYVIYLEPHASDETLGRALLEARWSAADLFRPVRHSLKQKNICDIIGRRISRSAIRPSARNIRTWIGVAQRGPGGRFGSIRTSATCRNIFSTCRQKKQLSLRRRPGNAEAVGAAARLALNRCENTFPPGDLDSSRCRRLIRQQYLRSAGGRRQSPFGFARRSLREKVRPLWARGVFEASHRVWRLAGNSWSRSFACRKRTRPRGTFFPSGLPLVLAQRRRQVCARAGRPALRRDEAMPRRNE